MALSLHPKDRLTAPDRVLLERWMGSRMRRLWHAKLVGPCHALWVRWIGAFALAAAALLGAGWILLVWIPPLLINASSLDTATLVKAENDARGALVQAVGGAMLAGGLVFTARSYVVAREGQVTDRYTAAVNQLGDRHLPVRLGGIYALERIARDSQRDRNTIVEILSAVVRETKHPDGDEGPAPEVVAALRVISRLPGSDGRRAIDLRGVDLSRMRLHDLALAGADMTGAKMELASLPGADLRWTRLDYVKASRAELVGARFTDAAATRTDFGSAILNDADMARIVAPGASFLVAALCGVDARGADFAGANLRMAQLVASKASPTRLAGASLKGAEVEGMNVAGVDLRSVRDMTPSQRNTTAHDGQTRWPGSV